MTVRKVNVLSCELDESLDEAGFRHAAAAIGDRLGARRIGAGVYEAFADCPIWPYHYHYSSEEWLYVISGAPVLRDAGGRRTLSSGDLLCFPPDHRGAHTMFGPGRFIIFSTNESSGPWVAVYPDSDKISVSPGLHESTELNALKLPRSRAVGYWHGEGSANRSGPQAARREPADTPSLPLVNALSIAVSEPGTDAGAPAAGRSAALGEALGGVGLNATVVEVDPAGGWVPYRYEHGREEWVLILSGSATLRHPGGMEPLGPGDVVCFAEGPGGAHQVLNGGSEPMRAIFFSTTGLPANVCYPDSATWVLRHGPHQVDVTLRHDPAHARGG
jgi:uncharacterized cupin superfamily protein